jgi:hypothetical protein
MRTGGTAIGPKGKHDPDRSATRLRAAHVTHDRQDRSLWDTHTIANGGRVLQSTLAVRRPGRYQIDAAVAALRDDAASAGETGRRQTLAWYDELFALTDDPVPQDPFAVLGRAVAVGHVLGAAAGLRQAERLAGKSEPPVRPRNHSYTDLVSRKSGRFDGHGSTVRTAATGRRTSEAEAAARWRRRRRTSSLGDGDVLSMAERRVMRSWSVLSCWAVDGNGQRRADLVHAVISEPAESLDEDRERDALDRINVDG